MKSRSGDGFAAKGLFKLTNLDVYAQILMYIYMNLDVHTPAVYIRILMHISLSCHVNNNCVVWSVFNKHTLIVRGYYFFNLYANVQLVKHEPSFITQNVTFTFQFSIWRCRHRGQFILLQKYQNFG